MRAAIGSCYDGLMAGDNRDRDFAVEIVRRLQTDGFEAYWAGGCVRDRLLGRQPKDYDVATNALPEQIRLLFGHRRTLAIGAAFGVISVLGPHGVQQVEVATFRQDAAYSDGRRPDAVAFSTPEEDALRRDFTINGLFFDPLSERVIDYVGGQRDLEARVVRAIGDPRQRFAEDKLRLLRAIRFAAALDFDIDPATFVAIQELHHQIVIVSAERIAAEMERLLVCPNRRHGLKWLRESGLLSVVMPELQPLLDDSVDAASAWNRSLAVLEHLCEPTFAMALAALARDAAARQPPGDEAALAVFVDRIGRRWRLSVDTIAQVSWFLTQELLVRTAETQPWPRLQRVLVAPYARELLDYVEAVTEIHEHSVQSVEYCRQRLQWPIERLNPNPLISGNDLIELGLSPGPRFRQILEHVRDAQLLGEIDSRSQAIELVGRLEVKR